MQTLHQLVYFSEPRPGLNEADLKRIRETSMRNNERHDLSGFLAFHSAYFIQVLEGSRGALSQAFTRIARDERHSGIVLMGLGPIDARRFPEWSMGHADITGEHLKRVLRYSSTSSLSPADMTVEGVVEWLEEISAEAMLLHQRLTPG